MSSLQPTPKDDLAELAMHGAKFASGIVDNISQIKDHYASVGNRLDQILRKLDVPQDVVRKALDDNIQKYLRSMDERLSDLEKARANGQSNKSEVVAVVDGLKEFIQEVLTRPDQSVRRDRDVVAGPPSKLAASGNGARASEMQHLRGHIAGTHASDNHFGDIRHGAAHKAETIRPKSDVVTPMYRREHTVHVDARDAKGRSRASSTGPPKERSAACSQASPAVDASPLPAATIAVTSSSTAPESSKLQRKAPPTSKESPSDDPPNEQGIDGAAGVNPSLPVTRMIGKEYRDPAVAEADYAQNLMSNDDIERLRKALRSTAPGSWSITLESIPVTMGVHRPPEDRGNRETAASGEDGARRKSRRIASVVSESVTTFAKSSAKTLKKRRAKERVEKSHNEIDDPEARPRPYKKLRTLSDSRALPDSVRPHYKTAKSSAASPVAQPKSNRSSVPGGVSRSDVLESAASSAGSPPAKMSKSSPNKRIEVNALEFRQIVDEAPLRDAERHADLVAANASQSRAQASGLDDEMVLEGDETGAAFSEGEDDDEGEAEGGH
ncbi:hypothetical protein LTR95_006952 [Oleoguttula sp. CCFEE 5521]